MGNGWLRTHELGDKRFFRIPGRYYGDIIYRPNVENIHKNAGALGAPEGIAAAGHAKGEGDGSSAATADSAA